MSEQLPLFICIASTGDYALAYGHVDDLAAAEAWCARARESLLEHAEQVAITKPQEVEWIVGGASTTLVPIDGWRRSSEQWERVDPKSLFLSFMGHGPGPTPVEELEAPLPPEPSAPDSQLPERELRAISRLLVELGGGIRRLASAARPAGGRLRVLVVDDEPVSREVLRRTLSSRYDVAVADGFASALLELAHWDFDAVITDQNMEHPGTGLDLLAEVQERWPRMRRLLCTANTSEVERAMASGVAHHLLRKPVDRVAVFALLNRL